MFSTYHGKKNDFAKSDELSRMIDLLLSAIFPLQQKHNGFCEQHCKWGITEKFLNDKQTD